MTISLLQPNLRRAPWRTAAAAVALALPLAAWAGAGAIVTTVVPLADTVTYSSTAITATATPALDTFVGYTVSITNAGGNTINNVRFTGTTVVTDAQQAAPFSSVEGASCSITNGGRSVECAIGQLRAGQSFPTFALFFKAPVKDIVTPTPNGQPGQCATTDCVSFSGATFYAEGTGGVPQSTPQNSTSPWSAAQVLLGTANPTRVRSAVPRKGGAFFTGSGAIPNRNDIFTTFVSLPAGPNYSTLLIDEPPVGLAACNSNNFRDGLCSQTDLTILADPQTTAQFMPYLTVVLRQDFSAIVRGTKIDSVILQYSDPKRGIVDEVIGDCASPTTPRTDGRPCIAQRKAYTRRNIPGWTPELDGDFEWTLISTGNGGYRVR